MDLFPVPASVLLWTLFFSHENNMIGNTGDVTSQASTTESTCLGFWKVLHHKGYSLSGNNMVNFYAGVEIS